VNLPALCITKQVLADCDLAAGLGVMFGSQYGICVPDVNERVTCFLKNKATMTQYANSVWHGGSLCHFNRLAIYCCLISIRFMVEMSRGWSLLDNLGLLRHFDRSVYRSFERFWGVETVFRRRDNLCGNHSAVEV